MDLFDVSPTVAIVTLSVALLAFAFGIFYFVHSAPPTSITISAGPEGSVFHRYAVKYQKILAQNGVKLKIETSEGSLENLKRLIDPKSKVDVGIVQGGIVSPGIEKLISLGSISFQPLMVFYRGQPIQLISELSGKKIAVGPEGSGGRNFALAVLAANGIKENDGHTTLLGWDGQQVFKALESKEIDAAFIMSESASMDILHNLLRSQEIHLFSFKQANAYSRKIDYLNVLDLPEGSLDLGQDIPAHDVTLLGPMVELVAKQDLHPALSDLLLEAATQVHNHSGIYQRRGEFPAAIEHAIRLSPDASRFFQSGKGWLYRMFPFWLASLISRITVVFLPIFVILIPLLKSIPAFFRWKTQMKIRRHYRDLLTLEQNAVLNNSMARQDQLRREFERIEYAVNKMKVRAAFADQFYSLRGHIDYVEQLVTKPSA